MIRRSLFFGITLVLLLAFVFLSIRGCRQEVEPAGPPIETVEKSNSSATRVLQPQDLEIARSEVVLEKNAGSAKPSLSARHEIEIMNRGSVPYREIGLRIAYRSRAGKVLETRNYSVAQTIRPGVALKLADIRMDGLPESAAEVRVSIAYADIGNASQTATPHN
jgi:hypothetical protein